MSHGQCWLWDPWLVIPHGIGSLSIWIAYMIIPLTAAYIYSRGNLSRIYSTYPGLWRWGIAFVLSCGFTHLGEFVEVWHGGRLYYATAILKLITAAASYGFAISLWRAREEMITLAKMINTVLDIELLDHKENSKKTLQ